MAKASRKKPVSTQKKELGIPALFAAAIALLAGTAAVVGNYDKVCSFADARLGTNFCLRQPGSLLVSAFYDSGKLSPGNDHALRSPPPTNDGTPVFQAGARLQMNLTHNGQGAADIVVTNIALDINYDPKTIAALDYDYGPDNLKGLAIVNQLTYRVRLDGGSAKVTQAGSVDPIPATDLLGDKQVSLSATKLEAQSLEFFMSPRENGLYRMTFEIGNTVAGETRSARSQDILIYRNEAP